MAPNLAESQSKLTTTKSVNSALKSVTFSPGLSDLQVTAYFKARSDALSLADAICDACPAVYSGLEVCLVLCVVGCNFLVAYPVALHQRMGSS